MKALTVDVNGKTWFDKINGNSYFSAQVTIDYGLITEKTFPIEFQYGYGSYFEQEALKLLKEKGYIHNDRDSLSYACREEGIILRSEIVKAKKADAKAWGKL